MILSLILLERGTKASFLQHYLIFRWYAQYRRKWTNSIITPLLHFASMFSHERKNQNEVNYYKLSKHVVTQLTKCPHVQEKHSTRAYMPIWRFWNFLPLLLLSVQYSYIGYRSGYLPANLGWLGVKWKNIVPPNIFSAQFIKINSLYKMIGYNINVFQQTACLVVNPITLGNVAFLFYCTQMDRTLDSMKVLT